MDKPVRVLVVDDSALMRKLISDILEKDPQIEVAGTAKDGQDAIDKAHELDPDVITLDIEMPKMDGLTALIHIMSEKPKPIIMLSAMDKRQSGIAIKALTMGAVDFVSKPSGTISLDIERTSEELIRKIKMASIVEVKRIPLPSRNFVLPKLKPGKDMRVVVVASSTGGPSAITEFLKPLPRGLPAAILIVQHMPEALTKPFAERLSWLTSMEVKEAVNGEVFMLGHVYIAKGNHHLEVRGRKLHITKGPRVNHVRPSADVLMETVSGEYGPNSIGVVLTGMGFDGAEGMKLIKEAGGVTITQDEETSTVFGMPKAAIDLQVVDYILPLDAIPSKVMELLGVSG